MGVSLMFVGLGMIVERVGARFRSDDRALEIIKKARNAIGGDAALTEVRGLVIKGRTTKSFDVNGVEQIEEGESEIGLQYPDKMYRSLKFGKDDGSDPQIEKRVEAIVVGDSNDAQIVLRDKDGKAIDGGSRTVVLKRTANGDVKEGQDGEIKVRVLKDGEKGEWQAADGDVKEIDTADGKRIIVRKIDDGNAAFTATTRDGGNVIVKARKAGPEFARHNEFLRTTLSLLLSAPEGMDVSYTFAGDTDLDGVGVSVVNASFAGASYKLFFDRSTSMPVAMSYVGHAMPAIVKFRQKGDASAEVTKDILISSDGIKGQEPAEILVKFSDYRSTNGVQLPYKWTTSVGGKLSEIFDVTSYDVNPANLSDRFGQDKVLMRIKKDGQ